MEAMSREDKMWTGLHGHLRWQQSNLTRAIGEAFRYIDEESWPNVCLQRSAIETGLEVFKKEVEENTWRKHQRTGFDAMIKAFEVNLQQIADAIADNAEDRGRAT